jgi:hypothetical protein
VIMHRASLNRVPRLCKTFRDKKDGCIKVVLSLEPARKKQMIGETIIVRTGCRC